MDLSMGAEAELFWADDSVIMYKYGTYNNYFPEYQNRTHITDGLISIWQSCFKDNHYSPTLLSCLKEGLISIENTSNCWSQTPSGYDSMAIRVLDRIFNQYYFRRTLPNKIGFSY